MLNAIFSPITLAVIGVTLVTLAASNASENENERTEQMLQELLKSHNPTPKEAPKAPSKTEPSENADRKTDAS